VLIWSATEKASKNNHVEIVDILLTKCPAYNSALEGACQSNNLERVKTLYSEAIGKNIFIAYENLIYTSCDSSSVEIAKFIVEKALERHHILECTHLLKYACKVGNLDFVKYVFENIEFLCAVCSPASAFKEACEHEHDDIAIFLYVNGFDYENDFDNNNIVRWLGYACYWGRAQLVLLLVKDLINHSGHSGHNRNKILADALDECTREEAYSGRKHTHLDAAIVLIEHGARYYNLDQWRNLLDELRGHQKVLEKMIDENELAMKCIDYMIWMDGVQRH
jgi:hypothetical protein